MHEWGKVTGRNQVLQSDETKTSPLVPYLLNLLTASKNHRTVSYPVVAARCLFQSMSSDNLVPSSVSPSPSVNLKPSWFSSETQTRVLQLPLLLQGRFACEFPQDCRARSVQILIAAIPL